LAVVGLFFFMRRVWPESALAAWSASLLFVTHPLHDEAVTYLAARGHTMATALCILTLMLYARLRLDPDKTRLARAGLLLAALLSALLAALAKEVALTLPMWMAVFEFARVQRARTTSRALRDGAIAGLLFLLPAAGSLGLRYLVVGLGSNKLKGVADHPGLLLERCLSDLPGYALIGGLPLPFALMDFPVLQQFRWLGWCLLVGVVAAGLVALGLCAMRKRSVAPGLIVLGLAIVVAGLIPVFWADLSLRRRYLYMPSVGIVLVATVALHALAARFPRGGRVLLAVLVLAGSAATVHRNDLYRRSGEVARNLIETARGAPVGQPVAASGGRTPRIALVTLPRAYGGDFVSGAYLFHHTDLRSAFAIFGIPQRRMAYAMKCYHADDYSAQVVFDDNTAATLVVSFRTRSAYDAALGRDPEDDSRGKILDAVLVSEDPAARELTYEIKIKPGYLGQPGNEIYLYSDAAFRRIP
jgi:hypothetical protein